MYGILAPRKSPKLIKAFIRHSSCDVVDAKRSCEQEVDHHADHENEASLYVHWPYCERRCTYCNFNKYISRNVDHVRMRECLVQETKTLFQKSGVHKITSIFFGGGTPSLAQPRTLEAVIDTVIKHASLQSHAEISMEVNPTSTELCKLRDFKASGINRVSIGIQALEDEMLKVLGRDHSVYDSLGCLESARMLFPGKTSIDVIFGRPGQTNLKWREELHQILLLADKHISLYQLTLERGTLLFKQVQEGLLILDSAGFNRYEVSNFSRNEKAESVHNKSYWEGKQYIGVGPGAHGRFVPYGDGITKRQARIQTLEPNPWMAEVQRTGHGTRKAVSLSTKQVLQEILMLGMRTENGVPENKWKKYNPPSSLTDMLMSSQSIKDLVHHGYLILDEKGVKATSSGLNVADRLIVDILHCVDKNFMMRQEG